MPKRNYGPMEGVDAASKGDSRLGSGGSIRQHGFDAPARKPRTKTHTVTVREAAGKVADWVNSKTASKPAAKGAGLKKKRR